MSSDQVKLGPILLAPGIRRSHVIFFIIAYVTSLSLNSFIGIVQPFVLTEMLHVSRAEQGAITGALVTAHQGAMILFLLIFGALADRLGRRIFVLIALSLMTLVLVVYPLAGSVAVLFGLRFLFGTGTAAFTAGGGAMRIDLPDNNSRGRMSILMNVANVAAGALFVSFLGARMPAWLMDRGLAADDAGRYTCWILAILGLLAIVASLGLKKDRGPTERHRAVQHVRYLIESLREVAAHARVNPRYRITLLLAPITRSDSLIMGTFLSLWIMAAGHDQGLDSGQAMRTLSNVALVVSVADIGSSFLMGLLADKFDRLRLAIVAVSLTVVAFSTPLWVTSVTGFAVLAVVAFIQIAEGATTVSISALMGEVTPPHMRASTNSVYVWLGMISGMLVGLLGGLLFDWYGHAAPFLMISTMGLLWLIIAATVLLRGRRPSSIGDCQARSAQAHD